jgi:ribosomal protein S1
MRGLTKEFDLHCDDYRYPPPKLPTNPKTSPRLFEESLSRKEMRQGEVITAEVVRVDANFVVVNAGLKSESYIAIEEFRNDRGELEAQPGDFVQVAIEALETATAKRGSHARRRSAWPHGTSSKSRSSRARSCKAWSTAR